jgi:hypothetical protein
MRNTDLRQHSERELELWIDNDEYFQQQWRHTLRTGSMSNIKDAFEEAGFSYRQDQWEHLVELFEEAMTDRAEEESPGVHF